MDISPELLKLIQEAYAKGKDESEVLAEIMAKVGAGTATYSEANDYAVELGRIMAEAFGQNLSSKVLPQGKMYWNIGDKVIRPTVTQGYEDVADVAELVQTGLNEAAGIHIKAQRPQIDQRRIDRMIGDLMGLPDYDSGSQGFLNAVQNLLHSSVDDSIRTNAEFHYKAGLKPKIVRTLSGKCCEWCTAIAGSYTYPDVPRDVYKRHDNCRCKVDYKTADGKTQSVHSGTEGRRKYVQVKNDPREHYELSKAERIRHAKEMEATEDARKEAARQKRQDTWTLKKEIAERERVSARNVRIIRNDEERQEYRIVSRGEKTTMYYRQSKYTVKKVNGYENVYISDIASIKPKALHIINKNTNKILKEYGVPVSDKPTIVIVHRSEIHDCAGIYDAITNTVFYCPEIANQEFEKEYNIERHELWHCRQAYDFRKKGWIITEENYGEYLSALCEEKRKVIAKLGINQYNVSEISDYAFKKFFDDRFDEVEAEYMVRMRR